MRLLSASSSLAAVGLIAVGIADTQDAESVCCWRKALGGKRETLLVRIGDGQCREVAAVPTLPF
jgi:hypothetical protein